MTFVATRSTALGGEAWVTASDSSGGGSLPLHAATEEEPQTIVVVVAESMAHASHLLDEQVDRLRRAVGAPGGGVEGEDLGLWPERPEARRMEPIRRPLYATTPSSSAPARDEPPRQQSGWRSPPVQVTTAASGGREAGARSLGTRHTR